MSKCLLSYSLEELITFVKKYNQPTFRAKQLYEAVNKGIDLDNISNIPICFRQTLISEGYYSIGVKIIEKLVSKDKTIKYLFRLVDGNVVEGVAMTYKYGVTLCISTQVGCRMNCAFCASGIGGLVRNMSWDEILGEVIVANLDISNCGKRAITNIVLMGTGEPLDNYDNVVKFLSAVNDKSCLNISMRNISLSTSGIVPKIYELADLDLGVNLTLSLHAPFDEIRSSIMPVNKKYPIAELIRAAKYYFEKTRRRVYIEYCMINGVNDTDKCADELTKLLKGFVCHVNLIRLNYVKEKGLKSTSNDNVESFMKRLSDNNVSVTLRRSMGNDINGACGQLRKKYMEIENNEI